MVSPSRVPVPCVSTDPTRPGDTPARAYASRSTCSWRRGRGGQPVAPAVLVHSAAGITA